MHIGQPIFRKCAVLLLATFACLLAGTVALAQPAPSPAANAEDAWTEYPLAQRDNMSVTLRVRKSASVAHSDWLQIIIDNAGPKLDITPKNGYARYLMPRAEVTDKSTGKVLRVVDLARSVSLDPWTPLGVPGPSIPAGRTTIVAKPSAQAALALGTPDPNVTWRVRVAFEFRLSLRYDLNPSRASVINTPAGGVPIEFDWRAPTPDELKSAITLTHDILKSKFKNDNETDYILPTFLSVKEIGDSISIEEAIAALQLQGNKAGPVPENSRPESNVINLSRFALLRFVADHWQHDPKLVVFIAESLLSTDRANVALEYLNLRQSPWDDALVEPLFQALEKSDIGTLGTVDIGRVDTTWQGHAGGPRHDFNFARFTLAILEKHSDAWAGDEKFVARAGKAIQRQWAAHLSPADPRFSEALSALATSRDPQVIVTLRPLLDDKTVVRDSPLTVYGTRYPTLRACDLAYSAAAKILGVEDTVAKERGAQYDSVNFDARMNETWNRWDKAVSELKTRIDNR
jgi:hypothetical protein